MNCLSLLKTGFWLLLSHLPLHASGSVCTPSCEQSFSYPLFLKQWTGTKLSAQPVEVLALFVSHAHSHNAPQPLFFYPVSAACFPVVSLTISVVHLLPTSPLPSLLSLTWMNARAS